jgi:hypothetical protein
MALLGRGMHIFKGMIQDQATFIFVCKQQALSTYTVQLDVPY